MSIPRLYIVLVALLSLSFVSSGPRIGDVIDSYNNVAVYFNGNVSHVQGRNMTHDGYNLGLRFQCVEFVKRYYYEHYGHKMPDSYGHAKSFFNKDLPTGGYNAKRGLLQFKNIRYDLPQEGDIIVYGANRMMPFGHMGIVSKVTDTEVEMVQQNWGKKSRRTLKIVEYKGIYTVADYDLLGWMRLP